MIHFLPAALAAGFFALAGAAAAGLPAFSFLNLALSLPASNLIKVFLC